MLLGIGFVYDAARVLPEGPAVIAPKVGHRHYQIGSLAASSAGNLGPALSELSGAALFFWGGVSFKF